MKNYKNRPNFIFKLLMLITALNINFVTCAMISSARKMIVPAVQSSMRAMTTEASATVPTIIVPVSSLQNFQPMSSMSSQPNLNHTDGIFKNIPAASLLPQSIAQASSSNSDSGSGSNSFNAATTL